MLAAPKEAMTAMSITTTAWITWDCHMRLTRSRRSTIAPIGSDSTSQGRNVAADTTDTRRGSWVIVTASNGTAAAKAPSPTLSMAFATWRRR